MQFIAKGLLEGVASVEQRPITLEEAKGAKEVFFTSTSLPVQGVTTWDNQPIANGEVRGNSGFPYALSSPCVLAGAFSLLDQQAFDYLKASPRFSEAVQNFRFTPLISCLSWLDKGK